MWTLSIVALEFFANAVGFGLKRLHQFGILFGATAVQPGAEYRDNFEQVLGKFLLEAWALAFMEDHNLNALTFTTRKDKLRAKAKKAVFVGMDEGLGREGWRRASGDTLSEMRASRRHRVANRAWAKNNRGKARGLGL